MRSWCDDCGFDYKTTLQVCNNPNCPSKNINHEITYTDIPDDLFLLKLDLKTIMANYELYIDNPSEWKEYSQEGSEILIKFIDELNDLINSRF